MLNLQTTPTLGKLTEADLDAAIARKFEPLQPDPFRPLLPVVHRASQGRQRAFLSFSDAAAYDRGYRAYPLGISADMGTPEAMAWADARDDAEGAAGMDDTAEWARSHATDCGLHL